MDCVIDLTLPRLAGGLSVSSLSGLDIGRPDGGFVGWCRMFRLYTSGMVGGSGQLLERGGELARIDQAVADLRHGHGGVLVIQGPAGIGKSTLLRMVCERAAEQRVQTLTARASELERDFGFGVARGGRGTDSVSWSAQRGCGGPIGR